MTWKLAATRQGRVSRLSSKCPAWRSPQFVQEQSFSQKADGLQREGKKRAKQLSRYGRKNEVRPLGYWFLVGYCKPSNLEPMVGHHALIAFGKLYLS
jgi:hypothetical protein